MLPLKSYKIPLLLLIALSCFAAVKAQTAGDSTMQAGSNGLAVPSKVLSRLDAQYTRLSGAIDKQTAKVLEKMQRKEAKLQAKLQGIDSTKAKQLFASSQVRYRQLQAKLQNPALPGAASLQDYIPRLDSIKTSLDFLAKTNITLPAGKLQQLQAAAGQAAQLQGKLQVAQEVQQYIREREAYLKQQLQNTPLYKAVTGINKEVYYYQQRLAEYKSLLNDPAKLGEKLLSVASAMPAFQRFFQKNSILAQLFRMPGTDVTPTATAGLQTRAGVQAIIVQRVSAGGLGSGTSPRQYLQQQTQAAESQLQSLKDKLNKFTGGGNSDMTMPDFKPNPQHTKTFFQRIQYGFNIQSQRGTGILPATSSLALTAGYKLSDSKTLGIGINYNLGLGNGFSHIRFTNEGVGFRSFADIKLKGSFWLTGGFEYTYYQAFAKLSDIRNLDIWQKSALLGLSKKYSIGKKREGNVQVLYDFLAYKQVPAGQPLKFRLGYSF